MKSGSIPANEAAPFPRRLPATVAALALASLGGCSVFEPLMPAPPPPPAPAPPRW